MMILMGGIFFLFTLVIESDQLKLILSPDYYIFFYHFQSKFHSENGISIEVSLTNTPIQSLIGCVDREKEIL